MVTRDSDYYRELQTRTGWGRTLYGFAAWCVPQPGWRVLDVGCGPGLLSSIFARMGCWAVGIDLDGAMFQPAPLHSQAAIADVHYLPFKTHDFDLITACNLVFLLSDPAETLRGLAFFLARGGRMAMLNPSEALTEVTATRFADESGLTGLGRQTIINWARRAEANFHWNEDETYALYRQAGMKCMGCELKVGPGFGRFSWGMVN